MFLITAILLIQLIRASFAARSYCRCEYYEPSFITCHNVGSDGRALDEILEQDQITIPGRGYYGVDTTISFKDAAPRIKWIYADYADGNFTIRENSFANVTSLKSLEISGRLHFGGPRYLSISKDELVNMPELRTIRMEGFIFTNETIEALGALKDRVNNLTIKYCEPANRILEEVQQFTNLTYIYLKGMCTDSPLPDTIFNNSASKLETVHTVSCQTPRISRNHFRGMTNLRSLKWWTFNNIAEIEPGAFDDLQRLQILDLSYNRLKRLPDGLFSKMTNLTEVDLSVNDGLENLSRENFTHCPGLVKLDL